MRRLSRRQVVILTVFAIWALLLAVGLFGGSVAALPKVLTTTTGTVALVALFWSMPASYLYVLVHERRQGAIRTKGMGALAVRRRWYFAFVSAYTLFIGSALLVPSVEVSGQLRMVGAVVVVWGLIALAVAVLAFRTKPLMADAKRAR